MDRIVSSSHDRTSLLSTHKVLRNTYFLLSLTLAFSAITATASTVLMLPSPGLILTLVGMYGLMFLTYREYLRIRLYRFSGLYPRTYSEHLSVCRNG